jgi:hypothetical protein
MKNAEMRELHRRMASQHGVIARMELRALGVDRWAEQRRVATGVWQRLGKHVIRLAGSPASPHQLLMAACLEAGPGAVASHQSAAWLWGLMSVPKRHAVTIRRNSRGSVQWAEVHRTRDLPHPGPLRAGIPCTNPLRALVDLAGVEGLETVELALDRALAARLVTVQGVMAEIDRLGSNGRRGVGLLRRVLVQRGYVGAPHPSVLESRMLRLLDRSGIQVLGTEVWVGEDGRYRVDTALTDELMVEVDGYAYHHTPEQKAEDERRRNRIRLGGRFLLVYTWRDVVYDSGRVIAEIRRALTRPSIQQLTGAVQRPPVL